MDFESLRIIFKAERNHRVENILAAYRLSLLKLTLLRRFGRDEADEFGHALLHALLGIFRDFSRWWHGIFHNTRHIGNLFGRRWRQTKRGKGRRGFRGKTGEKVGKGRFCKN